LLRRYEELVKDPSLLLHNISVVTYFSELDEAGGALLPTDKNLAFLCNAYNCWIIYKLYKRFKAGDGDFKGAGRAFCGATGAALRPVSGLASIPTQHGLLPLSHPRGLSVVIMKPQYSVCRQFPDVAAAPILC
jgi:hypothetical protein